MRFELLSAGVTVAGGLAFALLSMFSPHPAGDFFFFTSAVVFLAGPVMFLAYVLAVLAVEFFSLQARAGAAGAGSLAIAMPAPAGPVIPAAWVPEGLLRTPNGPMSPTSGRARHEQHGGSR
ncbi:MAG TPA: hypothetical protein VN655_16715 [Pseudolabrys sp.]|nr:hypothetical protein [Pseudolabrys sp.]